MTPKEAADYLGVSKRTLLRELQAGSIPHYRLGPRGGVIQVAQADLDAYRESRRVGARVLKHIHL